MAGIDRAETCSRK